MDVRLQYGESTSTIRLAHHQRTTGPSDWSNVRMSGAQGISSHALCRLTEVCCSATECTLWTLSHDYDVSNHSSCTEEAGALEGRSDSDSAMTVPIPQNKVLNNGEAV